MNDELEISIEEVEEMIDELFQTNYFTPQQMAIITYHFGLKGQARKTPREISRLVKVPFKKLEIEVKRLETKVFNLLKSR